MAEKNMNAKISVEFEETANRQQLSSGDNLPTLFGKIKTFFKDLKAVAFSGSYNDLSDTPTTATIDTDGLMSAEDKTKLDNADDTYALKSKYGDTTINVGRKAETTVGEYSTAEGHDTTASGGASHAEGLNTTASGAQSHAEGVETIASGSRSHAEGIWTIASGSSNHAEGKETTANGNNSCHAEGSKTTASGIATHAEGNSSNKVTDLITDFSWNGTTNDDIINAWNTQKFSVAHGKVSHVEGSDNLTLGHSSHAEGCCTVAIGSQSHTSGYYTKALHDNEAAYGKYNKSNDNTLFSIGDGTADDARHNAFEITTTGGKLHDKDIATTDLIPTSLPANGGNADTAKTLSDFVGVWQENLDDAPLGFCNAHGGTVNTPFGFWSTVITVGQNENYRQQIAFPWAEGETYIMPKFRVMDNGVWYSWKSCNPIRKVDINGSTDEHGSLLLWSSDGSIPIAAVGDGNRIFSPFIGSENNYYLAVRDLAGNAIANTTASATVFFI